MKPKYILIAITAALTVFFATHPPRQVVAKPHYSHAFFIPIEQVDTPDITEALRRLELKTDTINDRTRTIKRNSELMERDTHRLTRAVRATKDPPPADTTVIVQYVETPQADTDRRKNFWQKITSLFNHK